MNMKNTLQYVILPLLIVLAFYGCKKDLGNYDYDPVNVIAITTDMANVDPAVVVTNDSIIVKQNDSLKVNILLAQTKPSNDLLFEWMIIQKEAAIGNPPQYIVGDAQQLRTKILLPPGLYKLVARVTDKTTGVSFYKFYQLNVNTSPWGGEGWIVLQDQPSQGGNDISIITSRDGVLQGTVYSNLYSVANGHKLPAGTNKIAIMNYGNTLGIQKVAFFYPGGGIQVRSTDYLDSNTHNGWFLIPPSVVNIQNNGVFSATGQNEYIINNGQFSIQQVNATSIKSPPIKFGAPFLGTWPEVSSSLIVGNADGTFTLFDKINRCFFSVWNNNGLTLVPTSRADAPNAHYNDYSGAGGAANLTATGKGFDMNRIGRDLIYSENVTPMTGTISYDCIFRNTNGDSTFMYQIPGAFSGINGGYANNFITGRFFLSEAKVPGINTASIFAMPTFLPISGTSYGVFYYVHGTNKNQIYVCSPSYTGTLPATTTSSLGYSFPAGTIIRTMKVFKSGYTTAPITESKVLVVATDETASGGGHKVYFLNLSATGTINSTPANVYTGFDKILDIAFKKGLGL